MRGNSIAKVVKRKLAFDKAQAAAREEDEKRMKAPIEWKWTDEESGKSMKEKRVIDKLAGGRKPAKSRGRVLCDSLAAEQALSHHEHGLR